MLRAVAGTHLRQQLRRIRLYECVVDAHVVSEPRLFELAHLSLRQLHGRTAPDVYSSFLRHAEFPELVSLSITANNDEPAVCARVKSGRKPMDR